LFARAAALVVARQTSLVRSWAMPARPLPTVSITIVRGVFAEAIARGVAPAALCERFGVTPEQLADADARVGLDVIRRIWDELPPLVGANDFGLAVAERAHESGALGLVGYVLRSAPTLGDGVRQALRYQRILTDGVRGRWSASEGDARIVFEDVDAAFRPPRHAVEFGFASILLLVRAATSRPLAPIAIEMRHPRPDDDAAARRIFACALSYDAPENAIVLRREDLARPLASRDAHLSALLDRHARLLEPRLPDRASFTARVRRALSDGLAHGVIDLDAVAKRVAVSRRTVQRRLASEGTTLVRVLDELRRDLATTYLRDATLDIQEIALLLGFSDQSAFHHAFVRWKGKAPGAYRRGG